MSKPNGKMKEKLRQPSTDQQLILRTIQSRIFKYQADAGELARQASELVKLAQAADLEYQKAVQAYAKKLGVDLAAVNWNNEKLQFIAKTEPELP